MLKLLFLVAYPNISGPLPKILPILLGQLENFGCEIQQAFWSRHSDHESIFEKIFGRIQDIQRVRKQLQLSSIDMMVITTTHDWMAILRDLPLLLVVRSLCPKIVIHFHGSFSNRLVSPGHDLMKFFTREILKRVDAVLLFSNEEIREWSMFFPAMKYYRVDNPYVSQNNPAETQKITKTGTMGKIPTLFFAGRLVEEKGIFDLVEALSLIKEKVPFRLVFAGFGPDENKLKRKIQQSSLEDKITFVGYLQGKELSRAYQSADLFVFPSWREGFPLVLVEAMDFGLPIITTRISGAADRLVEGENTFFVNPKQPDELACAIENLLSDKFLRQKMSANNLKKVKEYAPDIVGEKYYDILKVVVYQQESA